ncbi:phosphoribosylformylglycinamidine cyclo-ligase, partial [Candidatus Woesearchaeota archaeon]
MTYADAGVDISKAEEATKRFKKYVKATRTNLVLSDVGLFGGMIRFPKNMYKEPVLVASTDGVGTKLKVAYKMGIHDTIGQDLVNHCVNDILVQGAKPLFFLDYIGTGKLEPGVIADIVKGLAKACRENNCALIGGETAEMPGIYSNNEYDLASCIVGVVERSKIIDGSKIKAGDSIIGLPSSG